MTARSATARSLFYDAFAHHIWATERILEACGALRPEQLTTPVPGTYGPIIDTLRHLIGTDAWYLSFFIDHPNPIGEEGRPPLVELPPINAANGAAWMALLETNLDGERDIVEDGDGWRFHAPLGFRLATAVQHGTDHRSQICTGLTSLGVEPPEIDLWGYGKATGRTRPEYLRQPPAG